MKFQKKLNKNIEKSNEDNVKVLFLDFLNQLGLIVNKRFDAEKINMIKQLVSDYQKNRKLMKLLASTEYNKPYNSLNQRLENLNRQETLKNNTRTNVIQNKQQNKQQNINRTKINNRQKILNELRKLEMKKDKWKKILEEKIK